MEWVYVLVIIVCGLFAESLLVRDKLGRLEERVKALERSGRPAWPADEKAAE